MIGVNLLPWRAYARKRRQLILNKIILGIVLKVIILYVLSHYILNDKLARQQYKLLALKQRYAQLEERVHHVILLKQQVERLFLTKQFIAATQLNGLKFHFFINDLLTQVPYEIVLTEMVNSTKKISLIGNAQSMNALTQLLRTFKHSQITDIKNLAQHTGLDFKLEILKNENIYSI